MCCEKTGKFLTVLLFFILCLSISPDGLCAESKVKLGLAAEYCGDKGIETNPNVIFSCNFENGITGWSNYRHGAKDRVLLIKDESIANNSAVCVQMITEKNKSTSSGLRYKWDPGHDQVYFRFYCKFHKDTCRPHHFVSMAAYSKDYVPGGRAGFTRKGNETFHSVVEPPSENGKGSWFLYSYWHEMRSWQNEDGSPNNPPDGDGRSFYGNNFGSPTHKQDFVRDKWICVEFMIKANRPGKHDGEQAVWINGEKIMHWKTGCIEGTWFRDKFRTSGSYNTNPEPFEGFSWRTVDELKINSILLGWYVSNERAKDSPTNINSVYFDDVVAATKYIGPKVAK